MIVSIIQIIDYPLLITLKSLLTLYLNDGKWLFLF